MRHAMHVCSLLKLLLHASCLVAIAHAMQHQPNHHQVNSADSRFESSRSLLTYYFDVSRPQLELSSHSSGRRGRTAVTVKLQESAVSKFMPVVSPQMTGMTHEVVHTWQALKVSETSTITLCWPCVRGLLQCLVSHVFATESNCMYALCIANT